MSFFKTTYLFKTAYLCKTTWCYTYWFWSNGRFKYWKNTNIFEESCFA